MITSILSPDQNNSKELISLAKFISTWMWQVIAIMMLGFSLILFSIPRNLSSSIFYISFFSLFIICELISIKRRNEFYHKNDKRK